MEVYGCVYQTENLINGKKYIGQTITKGSHLKSYLGSGVYFKKAVKKYGRENFEKEILSECFSQEELDKRERLYIKLLCPEYNLDNGGRGSGHKSKATIAKTIASNTGKKRTEEAKQKMKMAKLGKKLAPEHIEKIKQSNLGRACSEETKKKIGEANKGNNYGAGVRSEEFKIKISIANKGKKRTPEMNEANAALKRGKKQTPEHIESRRKGMLGHKVSDKCRESFIERMKNFKKQTKKVICIETEIVYDSIKEAAEKNKTFASSISNCCLGKYKKSGGFHWKYFEGDS